jgi:predicted Zn-dependent protease
MKLIVCIAINLLVITQLFSQSNQTFIPTKNDSLFFNTQLQQIETNYKTSISNLSGSTKKQIADIYKERFTAIKSYFTDKKLYSNTMAETYLKALLYEIVKNNPQLQQDSIFIFFNTTEIPNAASVGEKMLIFNTGLFRRLENESQVAFVLSHELAHLLLDHSNKQINRYVEALNSKTFQEE